MQGNEPKGDLLARLHANPDATAEALADLARLVETHDDVCVCRQCNAVRAALEALATLKESTDAT
jgi:hypothetical protein